MERETGIEPVLPAWESKLPALYFHNLQNRSEKINVHATHTVHAVPDLRIAGGRLGDVSLAQDCDHFGVVFDDRKSDSCAPETAHAVTVKSRRLKLTT